MALSRSEWKHEVQRSAAHKFGEDNHALVNGLRLVPYVAVAIGVGALGFAGHWAWTHALAVLSGEGPSLPGWFWLSLVSLLVFTVIAYRPGRIPSFSPLRFVKHAAFVIAWLTLIGFTVGNVF